MKIKEQLIYLHRLLAICYLPNPNNYPIINHIDGDKRNNNLANLEWCTSAHNAQHAVRIGLVPPPIPRYIYMPEIVFRAYAAGMRVHEIAKHLNIRHSTIRDHLIRAGIFVSHAQVKILNKPIKNKVGRPRNNRPA